MVGLEDSIELKSKPLRSDRSFLARSLGWLIRGIWVVCQVVLIAWGTLAIYYSNPAVGRAAVDVGGSLCSVRRLGLLGVGSTGHDRGLCRFIFCRCDLVDLDRSLTEP